MLDSGPETEKAAAGSGSDRACRRHAETRLALAAAEERVARLRRQEESQRRNLDHVRAVPDGDEPGTARDLTSVIRSILATRTSDE